MSILGLDDKKGHIATLIKIAKADGVISAHEVTLIKIIAIKMGISSDDFNEIVTNVDRVNSLPPSTKEEKEQYLYNIFLLMKADLKTDGEEQRICEELALRLGFGVSEVKRAADHMIANLDTVVSLDEFTQVLNKKD